MPSSNSTVKSSKLRVIGNYEMSGKQLNSNNRSNRKGRVAKKSKKGFKKLKPPMGVLNWLKSSRPAEIAKAEDGLPEDIRRFLQTPLFQNGDKARWIKLFRENDSAVKGIRSSMARVAYEICKNKSLEMAVEAMGWEAKEEPLFLNLIMRHAIENAIYSGEENPYLLINSPLSDADTQTLLGKVIAEYVSYEENASYVASYRKLGFNSPISRLLAMAFEAGKNAYPLFVEKGVVTKERVESKLPWDLKISAEFIN